MFNNYNILYPDMQAVNQRRQEEETKGTEEKKARKVYLWIY